MGSEGFLSPDGLQDEQRKQEGVVVRELQEVGTVIANWLPALFSQGPSKVAAEDVWKCVSGNWPPRVS